MSFPALPNVEARTRVGPTADLPASTLRERSRFLGRLLLALLMGLAAESAAAQSTREVGPADVAPLARFDAAQSLSIDSGGLLYVTDAQTSTVVVVGTNGEVRQTVGGAGTRVGLFDGPADVDPTNGLSLWVADAGNGRLQHFSNDYKFLESLPVGRIDPASGPRSRQPVFDVGRDGTDVRAEGEPIAVVSTSANELFAIDARESVVVKWDAQRRPERVIGGFGQREGVLREPVDLALLDGRLFVADRGRGAIFAYDQFGTFVDEFRPVPLEDVQALTVHNRRVWIVTPTRVYVLTADGRVSHTLNVTLDAPLVDAGRHRGQIFLLTPTRLFRGTWGEGSEAD